MKPAPDYASLARLTVIQHLRSHGIKIKHWNSKQRSEPGKGALLPSTGKIFGAPIYSLPQLCVPEYGNIPMFLVEVCNYLETHAQTEGLFRKSGSVVRQKLLKSKLDKGDNSLSNAPPCDVAGILKQFFRELPEPILPADLQDALYKAQNLSSDEERTSATMLISCLIPAQTVLILRYFFRFLHSVSMRSDANKMDSSNLAVIFAPNLLQSDDSEKISASTEKKLRVQATIVKTLIDQAADIGCVPDFLLERIPGMLGVDVGADTPGPEESDLNSSGERKRRRRKSVGVFSSMVTPLILTPSTKRKLPLDSVQGISNKKRKSIKQNLTFELLPSSLFGGGSTPASAKTEGRPCVSLETSESSFSPSVSSAKYLSSSGNLRRSKRCENRKVHRVESGKTGCFSPKISRKEMVRRSLRLRFSLGKSSKDVNTGFTSNIRSQNIGWRLANSQELTAPETKLSALSSSIQSPCVSAGSKKISKSEDNLLTPQHSDELSHRMSWTGPHPLSEACDGGTPLAAYLYATNCYSEPALVAGKPPAMPKTLMLLPVECQDDQKKIEDSLCEEENTEAQITVRRITTAFSESGSDLHVVVGCAKSPEEDCSDLFISEAQKCPEIQASSLANDLDGVVDDGTSRGEFYTQGYIVNKEENSTAGSPDNRLEFIPHVAHPQPVLKIEEENDSSDTTVSARHRQECNMEVLTCKTGHLSKAICPAGEAADLPAMSEPALQKMVLPMSNKGSTVQSCQDSIPTAVPVRRATRVSDHIQHFNKLCLSDRSAVQNKSPIKFQRTPVRQSVRRINSLSGMRREVENMHSAGLPMVKSVSCDEFPSPAMPLTNVSQASLSTSSRVTSASRDQLPARPLLGSNSRVANQYFRKPQSALACTSLPIKSVFEDLTNREISKATFTKSDLSAITPNNARRHILSVREPVRYKGSPKNPIAKVTLLPATKPLEL
ncbi:rho GTPase-activating protein 11A isoform X2 [Pseudophryne corroboree]|uniref:rho GTPase-activating protein 11A isoform X2 n=1 Tax=Pseudophryne corroboree TaxID=495146 RepID=UPI0030821700